VSAAPFDEQALRRYIPPWLPSDQHAEFLRRLAAAFERYCDGRGEHALADVLARGRVIGGVASAFKFRRLESTWGGAMRRRRGGLARLRQIAEAGFQRRAYYAAIGRLGWDRLKVIRQLQAMPPHVGQHAKVVLEHARRRQSNILSR
jgi:hypothetical protein